MRSLLAQTTIPQYFYGGGTANESRWWTVFCNSGSDPKCLISTPGALISVLLPNLLILAGVIFFGLILAGGIGMIVGAGKDQSPQDKAKVSAAITYGVIGFLLVVSAYFILQVISTVTGVNFIFPITL